MIVCIEKTQYTNPGGRRMIRAFTQDGSYKSEFEANLTIRDKLRRRKRAFFYAEKFGSTLIIGSETRALAWKLPKKQKATQKP